MDLEPVRGVVLIAALAALAAGLSETPAFSEEDQPFQGAAAPAFDLPALEGGRVALADHRGTTVVLHFGAGW